MSPSTTLLEPEYAEVPAGRDGPPPRRVLPRTSLPSSRAVLGGLLVALAALGAFVALRSAGAPPTTSFVVAASDIDPGARLGPDQLRLVPMSLPDGPGSSAFTSISALEGAIALAPLRAGELVQASAVVPAGEGETAVSAPASEISFAVERTRAVDGALNRGERVDLLATYGTGEAARTQVVARDALIVDIDNEADDAIGAASTVTVTLSLPGSDEVLEVAHATQVAEVTLVRTTKAAGRGDGADVYPAPADAAGDP